MAKFISAAVRCDLASGCLSSFMGNGGLLGGWQGIERSSVSFVKPSCGPNLTRSNVINGRCTRFFRCRDIYDVTSGGEVRLLIASGRLGSESSDSR